MNDRSDIERQLDELRQEIAQLRDLPVLSAEFTVWLGKLAASVAAFFGTNSQEMRDLRAISPEFPSEFYDSVSDRLGLLQLDDAMKNQLLSKLYLDVPKAIFRRRLHEYDDLIGAVIHGLRKRRPPS